jgi:DNA-binding transcriptional ArsR family regulator
VERKVAEDMAETIKVLAHPVRLQIVASLGNEKRSVGSIAAMVDRKPAFISQQLSIMKRRDVLTRTRCGRKVYYSIHDSNIAQLLNRIIALGDKKATNRPQRQ